MRGRRIVVPELASNTGVTCHQSRQSIVDFKLLKQYDQTNEMSWRLFQAQRFYKDVKEL